MRICFIGDSYVTGTGDEACQGWAGRLCAMERRGGRDVTLYNLGVRGQTSRDIARRWRQETAPRLDGRDEGGIVLSFGVNDCARMPGGQPRVSAPESLKTTRLMLEGARQLCPVLMVGPPPVGHDDLDARTHALSAVMADLCMKLSVPFLPIWEPLRMDPLWCAEIAHGDGLHPAGGGYAALARLVHQWPAWRAWMRTVAPLRARA